MIGRNPTLADLLAAKDRRKRGSGHHSAKLTPERVVTIREALALGVSPSVCAREMGVSRQAICAVRDGKTRKRC